MLLPGHPHWVVHYMFCHFSMFHRAKSVPSVLVHLGHLLKVVPQRVTPDTKRHDCAEPTLVRSRRDFARLAETEFFFDGPNCGVLIERDIFWFVSHCWATWLGSLIIIISLASWLPHLCNCVALDQSFEGKRTHNGSRCNANYNQPSWAVIVINKIPHLARIDYATYIALCYRSIDFFLV